MLLHRQFVPLNDARRSILERKELQSIHWSAGAALPFFGFALTMFLFYSFVPFLLEMNGATMLNLSLLTLDMWAILIRVGAYHEKVHWLYFIAFAAVALGLIYAGHLKIHLGILHSRPYLLQTLPQLHNRFQHLLLRST